MSQGEGTASLHDILELATGRVMRARSGAQNLTTEATLRALRQIWTEPQSYVQPGRIQNIGLGKERGTERGGEPGREAHILPLCRQIFGKNAASLLRVTAKHCSAETGYWRGCKFAALRGHPATLAQAESTERQWWMDPIETPCTTANGVKEPSAQEREEREQNGDRPTWGKSTAYEPSR
ncbi:hypothetical protein C8R47DRAFT_1204954 [Mycena vitilis]|nr:hypothetical protein C8R47DRAFT_1204954 [Mycena vitilis]